MLCQIFSLLWLSVMGLFLFLLFCFYSFKGLNVTSTLSLTKKKMEDLDKLNAF